MRFTRRRRESPWVGMAAGILGGIAGSIAIGQFHHLWARVTKSTLEKKGTDSTEKAAEAVSENVLQHRLTEAEKPKAAAAVHFGFGSALGALYGVGAAL